MSNWLVFLIGIVAGLLFGIISGRKNYESCREQVDKLETDSQARKKRLAQTEVKIGEAEHHLEEVTEEVVEAQDAARAAAETFVDEEAPTRGDEAQVDEEVVVDAAVEATVEEKSTVAEDEASPGAGKMGTIASADAENADSETVGTATEVVEADAASRSGELVSEQITECPQKLARVKGIGRVYEDKLYQAGIGTFWQVATASTRELAAIFGLKEFQAVDLTGIRQHARQLAEETGTVGMSWNGREPDDMEHLPGIGKTYEGRLYDAGVCTWEKLASLTPEELAAIVKAPKWNQPDYDAWIAFARKRSTSDA
jgi:predicted flap endonuclease-1-like 5' DNA nuclease